MKKFLLFVLFCLSFSQYEAQNYTPFPEKYGKWIIYRQGPVDSSPTPYQFVLYETVGDTIIAGLTYKKVAASKPYINTPPPDPHNIWSFSGPKQLAFAYRNNIPNKTVYILTDTNEVINGRLKQEYKWYDFKVNSGDTLKSSYAINWRVGFVDYKRIKVRSIDSTLTSGKYVNKFHFSCFRFKPNDLNKDGIEGSLIEGVGFEDNFIRTEIICPFEPLYIYSTYFSCSPTSVAKEMDTKLSFSIFPNPASTNIVISLLENKSIAQLKIFNSIGQVVYFSNAITEMPEINISSLSPGLYFVEIKTDKKTGIQKFIKH